MVGYSIIGFSILGDSTIGFSILGGSTIGFSIKGYDPLKIRLRKRQAFTKYDIGLYNFLGLSSGLYVFKTRIY